MAVIGLAVGLLLGLGGVPSAWAGKSAATVINTKTTGPVEPVAQPAMDAAVVRALREQQILDVPASDRDNVFAGEPKLAGCVSDSCLERIGRLLDSQLVVRAQATLGAAAKPAGAGDWALQVSLFEVEVGAVGATVTSDCHACTTTQAAQALGELVGRAVLESASRPRGLLSVTSTPSGGLVIVDGTELGFTPYKRPAFVGKHRILVRSAGFRSYQDDVLVAESEKQSLTVTLQAGADPAQVMVVESRATPVYKKWWFWAVIGGAAVAAGGITAGVILSTSGVVPNGTPGAVHIRF